MTHDPKAPILKSERIHSFYTVGSKHGFGVWFMAFQGGGRDFGRGTVAREVECYDGEERGELRGYEVPDMVSLREAMKEKKRWPCGG
jgi:hypothetical protein